MLLARIYEVLPLLCPKCGGEMKIIAFINEAVVIREILNHLGEPTSPPMLKPARGHRCGRGRVSSRTRAIRRRNRHRTTCSISASRGRATDEQTLLIGGDGAPHA